MPSISKADVAAISARSVNKSHDLRIADNMVVECRMQMERKVVVSGDRWMRPGAFHRAVVYC
jgi:hypothetical protein